MTKWSYVAQETSSADSTCYTDIIGVYTTAAKAQMATEIHAGCQLVWAMTGADPDTWRTSTVGTPREGGARHFRIQRHALE